MKTILIFLISFNAVAKTELYVLPKDIIEARDNVIASKKKLDEDILRSYFNLCNKTIHNDAEHIEFLAYQEITKLQCWELLLN